MFPNVNRFSPSSKSQKLHVSAQSCANQHNAQNAAVKRQNSSTDILVQHLRSLIIFDKIQRNKSNVSDILALVMIRNSNLKSYFFVLISEEQAKTINAKCLIEMNHLKVVP